MQRLTLQQYTASLVILHAKTQEKCKYIHPFSSTIYFTNRALPYMDKISKYVITHLN